MVRLFTLVFLLVTFTVQAQIGKTETEAFESRSGRIRGAQFGDWTRSQLVCRLGTVSRASVAYFWRHFGGFSGTGERCLSNDHDTGSHHGAATGCETLRWSSKNGWRHATTQLGYGWITQLWHLDWGGISDSLYRPRCSSWHFLTPPCSDSQSGERRRL